LPHEAWHLVQQAQGRVRPTMQMKGGVPVNDDAALEREADVMGERALAGVRSAATPGRPVSRAGSAPAQLFGDKVAVEFAAATAGLEPLQEGLQSIYATYRKDKKDKRNQIEGDYHAGSRNLLERQEFLKFHMMAKLYDLAEEKNKDLKFKSADARAKADKVKDALSDEEQVELKALAVTLARTHFKTIRAAGREDALHMDGLRRYEQRRDEIAAWEAGAKTTPRPNSKTPERGHKDAIDNLKFSIDSMAKAVAYHELSDKLVQDYEAGYMTSAFRKEELFRLWRTFAKKSGYLLITDISEDEEIKLLVSERRSADGAALHIGTVYENDKRFVKVGEHTLADAMQKPEVREIFAHRESGAEYVQDAHNAFVKRYVSRALNKYDVTVDARGKADIHIGADPRTKAGTGSKWEEIAQELATGNNKDQNMLEVFNHQRQKEAQGGSPFISFTTTEHDIFGSTGMNFEGEHGKARIDLAKIAKNRIIDTHTPEAFAAITGVKRPDPYMPFSEDPQVGPNSAARDSMRTRELVVLGNMGIPPEAVEAYRRKEGDRRGGGGTAMDFVRVTGGLLNGGLHHPITSDEIGYMRALASGSTHERLHGDGGAGTSDIKFSEEDWA
jgi:hypothetical protein